MQEETVQPQNAQNQSGDKSVEELLVDAQAKLEQQREQVLRAVAETENVRKRLQADAATAQKYALERFAENLLPVMDGLEAAVKSGDPSGMELVLKQFLAALAKSNVRASSG